MNGLNCRLLPDMNAVETNDTTAVELVPEPDIGTRRIVRYVTLFNPDTATQQVIVYLYDGTTYWHLMTQSVLTTVKYFHWPQYTAEGYIVLKHGWSMTVELAGAAATNQGHVTAHWEDDIRKGEYAD